MPSCPDLSVFGSCRDNPHPHPACQIDRLLCDGQACKFNKIADTLEIDRRREFDRERRVKSCRTKFGFFVGLVAVLTSAARPASAALEFCNQTEGNRSVAVAYSENKRWTSEGWWIVKPGECKSIVKGNLKQRYYYYRATTPGVSFKGDGYFFCTDPKPFTIVGDKNCQGRGYDRANFRKIDTGKSSKTFKLTLTGKSSAPEKIAEPGTYGEPATVFGRFQGCKSQEGGSDYCEIVGDEWNYVVVKDERTPASLYKRLEGLTIGQMVTIDGDLTGYGDITADIVARNVIPIAEDSPTGIIDGLLQGGWRSVDDSQSQIRFDQGHYYAYYNGDLTEQGAYSYVDFCEGARGDGKILMVTLQGDPDPYCYFFGRVDRDRLELIYAPRGNELVYERTGR